MLVAGVLEEVCWHHSPLDSWCVGNTDKVTLFFPCIITFTQSHARKIKTNSYFFEEIQKLLNRYTG